MLHSYDAVALRLSCAYHGAGTRHLPEAAVNRAMLGALRRPRSLPDWLQWALLQPWGWTVYNTLVRVPWGAERGVGEGDAILMKGSRWRRGRPRLTSAANSHRVGPALHRSPLVVAGDAGVERTVESGRRVLFTIDYSG